MSVPLGSVPVVDVRADLWERLGARHPGPELLVLLGSRAVGREHSRSDRDLGVLGDEGLDLLAVRADVVEALGTDAVDVVDLRRASAVLRRDAAVVGRPLIERGEAFVTFQIDAIGFWCDVEPVLVEAERDVLRALAG